MSPGGLILIDKPLSLTSRQVTNQVSQIFREKKAGHLGTLDPLATGLLPILLGPGTRLAFFLQNDEKQYLARIQLGKATTTMDLEGEVLFSGPVPKMTKEEIAELLKRFVGEIEQIPPMHSALKHKGKRLYQLARKGEEVERKPRLVKIFSIELKEFSGEVLEVLVHCGPGTYLRVLADDLGKILKCGAHLISLRRIKSGRFSIDQAVLPSELTPENCQNYLIPLEEVLDFEKLNLSEEMGEKIKHGALVPAQTLGIEKPELKYFRIFSSSCFAIGKLVEKGDVLYLQPLRVFLRN